MKNASNACFWVTQTEKGGGRRGEEETEQNIQDLWDSIKSLTYVCVIGVTEGKRGNRAKEIFEEIMAKNFLKLIKRVQATVPRSSENMKQDKNKHTKYSNTNSLYSSYWKPRTKRKSCR